MKIAKLATGIALWGAVSAGNVWAQGMSQPLRQPESIYRVVFQYDDLYLFSELGDEEGETTAAEAGSEAVCCDPCRDTSERGPRCGCGDACCGDDCGLFGRWLARDPWKLPQPCLLQRWGINTGGWFQAGITVNGQDPADNFNGPLLTNDRHGELQMQQLWLYFERPCDTGGYGFDVGGRFDLFYGTDWRVAYCHGLGLEDEINQDSRLYGLALPQFYLEVAVNRLSVKMGRMAGILGYEVIPPMGNFFYSHSYAICYTEPLLITGLMAKYQLTDRWTALAGFHQGVHRFEDNNDRLNFQGGLMWTSPNQRTSLAYALDTGRNDDAGLQDEYIHSLVFQYQLTERLRYVLQNDLGFLNGVAGGPDAEWYGINQYFLYTLSEHWSAGLRVEWFRDDDGVRIMGVGNLPYAHGWLGAPGYAGNFTELTLGLNWQPKANVILRPEVRWDWYDGPPNPAGSFPLPFENGTSTEQFTLAADLIVIF